MPRTLDLDETLTPAARQLLHDVVADYRAQLLSAAEASAFATGGELREIAIHDIIAALSAIQSRRRPRPSRLERFLRLYMIAGILLTAAGATFWIAEHSFRSGDLTTQLPLAAVAAGIFGSAVSYAILRFGALYRSERRVESTESLAQQENTAVFLLKWRDLETDLRRLAAEHLGESSATAPFSRLIAVALESGLLTSRDAELVRRLLDLRNRIVHQRDVVVSDGELRATLEVVDSIRKKLGSGRALA